MKPTIRPPVTLPHFDLERCRQEPLWCKKEIAKRLMLILLEFTRSKPLPFITHIDINGPGPTRQPVSTPEFISQYAIVSETKDGYTGETDATWALARDRLICDIALTTGSGHNYGITAWLNGPLYQVLRSFFYFDLSAIPVTATVQSVILSLTNFGYLKGNTIIQEGTQGDPLTTSDHQSFTGSILASFAGASGLNQITLNSSGIAYIQSKLGSTAKLCAREYDYDYLNVAPDAANYGVFGLWYANAPVEANRPILTINV